MMIDTDYSVSIPWRPDSFILLLDIIANIIDRQANSLDVRKTFFDR